MVHTVLNKIKEDFNNFLIPPIRAATKLMVGDISKHEKENDGGVPDASIENNIVLTLVNIEEENTLKNNYPIRKEDTAFITQRPTLYLNLYLLFTANFAVYEESLKHLGYVLQFFQKENKISFTDSFGNTYNLLFSLHNIGFENMNNLWMVLGNRYIPSVIYKVRLVFIQEAPPVRGTVITAIDTNEQLN
jgi:Pvc16 N-terminal domain